MKTGISLVVPILNEAHALPELLAALKAQTLRPDELVFVDAGSADGGPEVIHRWWAEEGWSADGCQVLSLPGAFPGAGRNAGVRAARCGWIAFLDAGIDPEPDWLQELAGYAGRTGVPGVFGVCRFLADTPFQRALCALTNGYGAECSVVPASLFRKEVFQTVGDFPEHLRAAEDLLWVESYERGFGTRAVCRSARVLYRHFPVNWRGAFQKWRIAEYFSVLAGTRRHRHNTLMGLVFLLLCLGLLSDTAVGLSTFLVYVLLRGGVDPARRSRMWRWWGPHLRAIPIALVMGVVLDLARVTGIVQGFLSVRRTAGAPLKQG